MPNRSLTKLLPGVTAGLMRRLSETRWVSPTARRCFVWLRQYWPKTPAQVLRLTGDLYQYGYDPRRLCHDLLEHFHDLVVAKVSPDLSVLADLPDHEVEIVQKQAASRSREDLQRFFSLLLETAEAVRRSAYTSSSLRWLW